MPVSLVPRYRPVITPEAVRRVPEFHQKQPPTFHKRVQLPSANTFNEPIVVAPESGATSKTEEDIRGIMKLLGVSDPTQIPSINEVMDMLGASTQEEAIDTVKEIAATEEGIELIKSFIESRQLPEEVEDEAIIEVITQPPPTTTTTTTPPLATAPQFPVTTQEQPSSNFWHPNKLFSAASAKVASRLDNLHTNTHLMNRILAEPQAPVNSSPFRNTLRNLQRFFTFQENTAIPLESFTEKPKPSPSVVYVNEPIPASPINLPALPTLPTLPALTGVRSIPAVPQIPQIQLPSHFSIPKGIVQGPYMKVKYPVASYVPLPAYRQRPLYSYRGQPIVGNAPPAPITLVSHGKSSYEVPLYGGPPLKSAHLEQQQQLRIPFSQSTRDAFQNAPQIVSSLPVPSLPYTFEEKQQQVADVDEQYLVAANTPIESVALPEGPIVDDNNQQQQPERDDSVTKDTVGADAGGAAREARGPQRLSGYEEYATGKVHRATNVDVVQSRLTNGGVQTGSSNYDDEDGNLGGKGTISATEEQN